MVTFYFRGHLCLAFNNKRLISLYYCRGGLQKGSWVGAGVCMFAGYHMSKLVLVAASAYRFFWDQLHVKRRFTYEGRSVMS
jgi:hypothetical protein